MSYIDFVNMINNGFVSKNAITFEVENEGNSLDGNKDKFILFQYDPNLPEIKYVWLNGKVKLPPIKKRNSKVDITNYNENIAIIGKNVQMKDVPSEYKVVGYFNTPNSYKLNSEIWLIPNKFNMNFKHGNHFIINTPNNDELVVLKKFLSQNSFKIINKEDYGSYSLNSNKFLAIGIQISLMFMGIIFMIIGAIWISKEKYFVRILYLSGYSIYTIFLKIIRYKILPYILFSILLIFTSVFILKLIFLPWTNSWILYSFYMVTGCILYLVVFSFILVSSHTVGKGGKKF